MSVSTRQGIAGPLPTFMIGVLILIALQIGEVKVELERLNKHADKAARYLP